VKNNIITPIIILSIVLGMTWSSCEVIDSVLSDAQVADGFFGNATRGFESLSGNLCAIKS
jgi:hypothetical protein